MENNPDGKIKPLATTKLMMTWLSMCPADKSMSHGQKMRYIANTVTVFVANGIHFTASLIFILKYHSTDFGGAAFAFMATSGTLGLIYSLIAALQLRKQIGNIFTSLSTIYDRCKFNQKMSWIKNCHKLKGHILQMKMRRYFVI